MTNQQRLDVICIGNLNFDITFVTDNLPGKHEKVRCDEVYTGFGGAAANTCYWLARLGLQVGLVGSLGKDLLGKMHLQDLETLGVDTSHIQTVSGPSGIAVIFSKDQEKRMIKTAGANALLTIDTRYLSAANHIHLSSNKEEIVKKTVEFCYEKNITVSYDPGEGPYPDCIEMMDYVMLNEDELKRLTKQSDWQKAMRLLNPKHLIMTKNKGGCVIKSSEGMSDIPNFHIKAIDTTGAGDAFDAGFVYALHKKKDLIECGYYGVAAASIKVQHVGARSSDINPESIEKMKSANIS